MSKQTDAGSRETASAAKTIKARLLADARHELRQPLAALSIYAGLLKSHVAAPGLPMLAHIHDCIANLNHLINTMLEPNAQSTGGHDTDGDSQTTDARQ